MQRFFHLPVIEKNIGTLVSTDRSFRTREPEAVRMPFNTTGNQIGLVRQNQRALAIAHELSFTLHGANAALEWHPLIIIDGELVRQFGFVHRTSRTLQRLHHVLTRGQRVFVLRFFPLVKWIESTDFGDSGRIL